MKRQIIFTMMLTLAFGSGHTNAQNLQPSQITTTKNEEVKRTLDFSNTQDFKDATRGFITTVESGVILQPNGTPSFSMKAWDFLGDDNPGTANPSLWRQSQLNKMHGLFEVVKDKIYQIRGFDLANMTFVRTNGGWIVIDPLSSEAPVKAGYDLFKKHVEKGRSLPIKAVVITHPHHDHYGGIKAILHNAPNKNIEIIAPKDYYESAVNENIMAGPAMQRRGLYMYGMLLPKNPQGNIGSGLGQTSSTGPRATMQPTVEVDKPLEEMTIDGLEMKFLYVTETEAPVEIMVYFPQFKAFCVAEEINRLLHNLVTLRGAKVRNGQVWSKAIDSALMLCGGEVECSFSTHNWPTWGNAEIVKYWETQRDMYRYIHDQTLRLANLGYTPQEIAEVLELPETIRDKFYTREYYGTISHNAKSQYQLYFGWFDGNPANLNPLPPTEAGRKYVEAVGGEAKVIELGKKAYAEGDYRWGAMLLNNLIFANPENTQGRDLLADIYTQMGYQAESGPWRNFYLTGAKELRKRPDETTKTMLKVSEAEFLSEVNSMTPEILFDFIGIKINGRKYATEKIVLNIIFEDAATPDNTLILSNGALTHRVGRLDPAPMVTVKTQRKYFDQFLVKPSELDKMIAEGEITVTGELGALKKFISYIDFEAPFFNIIEP